MLLLFALTIGARSLLAFDVWACANACLSEEQHKCCDCEEHEHDCDYHNKSLKGSCTTHNVEDENIATVIAEYKSSVAKRVILLTFIINPNVDLDEPSASLLSIAEYRVVDYTAQWICDIGLLRAPPIC